jgi:hypothetical protein
MDDLALDLWPNPFPPHDMNPFLADDSAQSDAGNPFPSRIKRVKWSRTEDQLLRHFVEVHGLGNWAAIAHNIAGRNPKQCRERWLNQLAPALSKDNWTLQEDAILVQQQRIVGNVWSQITQFLPGRSPNAIKNRWFWLTRRKGPAKMDPYAMWQMPMMPPSVPNKKRQQAPAVVSRPTRKDGETGAMPGTDLDPALAKFLSSRPFEPDGDEELPTPDLWSMAI